MYRLNIHTVDQPFYIRVQDLPIFFEVFADESYHPLLNMIDSTTVVMDFGANIGLSTIYFANKTKYKSIISYEPSPDNITCLRRNLKFVEHVEVVPHAISIANQTLSIDTKIAGYNHRITVAGDTNIISDNINEVINSQSSHVVVKMDIEGHEEDIFSGDTAWISAIEALIIEYHSTLGKDLILNTMTKYGFEIVKSQGSVIVFAKYNL